MTKQDIIEAYVWIRKNNNTIPDDVLDLMKRSAIEALEDKWIKIESEKDLPKEIGMYWVKHYNSTLIGMKIYSDTYENEWIEQKVTHYQSLQQPEPPLF